MSAPELFDAIHSAIAPRDFFARRAARLLRVDTEIIIVGTLHARHLGAAALGVGLLRRVIDHFEPTQVGIEARPHDLATGLVGLSPIDMAFVWAMAQQRALPVFGFDWWSEDEFAAQAERQEALNVNSDERNDRMAEAILTQCAAGGRQLLFMGYSHVQPIQARLLRQAFELDDEFRLDIEPQSGDREEEDALRMRLLPHLQRALDQLDATLDAQRGTGPTNAWTRRLLKKRKLLAQVLATRPGSR
jgi:hypothetical protein